MAASLFQEWTCRKCGRSKETGLPEERGRCDECAGPVEIPPGAAIGEEGERRTVLARLKQRYDEAREMASSEEPHANLDWLIGSSERPGFEPADFDVTTAQVALLWLQDLARELDGEALPAVRSAAGGQDRQGAARGLRTAIEDFAEAFLTPAPDSAGSS